MVCNVTDNEIKGALFLMGDDKAPDLEALLQVSLRRLRILKRFKDLRGHPSSVDVITQALEDLKNVSGLVLSIPKSTTFFCNVPNGLKATILSSIPFEEGKLKKDKEKVARDSMCKPKLEGGLVGDGESFFKSVIRSDSLFGVRLIMVSLLLCGLTIGMSFALFTVPTLVDDLDDVMFLRDLKGNLQSLSVAYAWESLRLRADVVDWLHVVWFPHCITHYAIHMWLVIKQKLRQWDVGANSDLNLLKCPLGDLVPDSHSYLFFECPFL
ncbi:reverse transcriptase domain, reverse transcriptase zinc-binding domain protein [Tanacetum coccineum]